MTNLSGRGPLGQKTGKKPKRQKRRELPVYIAEMHKLRCVACCQLHEEQVTPTRAHHCISGRFSSVRADDEDAIPLCDDHHQLGGNGKVAIHREKERWETQFGPDTDFIAYTRWQLAEFLPEDLK